MAGRSLSPPSSLHRFYPHWFSTELTKLRFIQKFCVAWEKEKEHENCAANEGDFLRLRHSNHTYSTRAELSKGHLFSVYYIDAF